jgi:DNA polymerase-3 subunit beta
MSSLLEGPYPEVQQLLPQNTIDSTITLPVASTKQALQQAAILSHEKFRAVELSFTKNKLTLSAHNAYQEKIENALTIDYEGEPICMAFNISYILDVIQSINHSEFTLAVLRAQNCAYIQEAVALGQKQFVIMSLTL